MTCMACSGVCHGIVLRWFPVAFLWLLVGDQSAYTSPAEDSISPNEKGSVNFKQPYSDLDPYPLVETSILLLW